MGIVGVGGSCLGMMGRLMGWIRRRSGIVRIVMGRGRGLFGVDRGSGGSGEWAVVGRLLLVHGAVREYLRKRIFKRTS